MTRREREYHKAKEAKKSLSKIGVGFNSNRFPEIRHLGERKGGAFFAMMLPGGAMTYADGSAIELKPKYIKERDALMDTDVTVGPVGEYPPGYEEWMKESTPIKMKVHTKDPTDDLPF